MANFHLPMPQMIKVKIIPSAGKNEIRETLNDGALKIKIKALPERGKANEE